MTTSPKCRVTRKRKQPHETENRQVWLVTCCGNDNVQYQMIGVLKPRYCPACGGAATSAVA